MSVPNAEIAENAVLFIKRADSVGRNTQYQEKFFKKHSRIGKTMKKIKSI